MRFWFVPLINENPCFILYIKQFTVILDKINGIKTSHHGLNIVGNRRATILLDKEKQKREFELISKNRIKYGKWIVA